VLKCGRGLLVDALSVLYFELTPSLYIGNKQDPSSIFEFLGQYGYDDILSYDNYGIPIEIVRTSDKIRIDEYIELIDNKHIYYYGVLTYHRSMQIKYKRILEHEITSNLPLIHTFLNSVERELESIKSELGSTKVQLASAIEQLASRKEELDEIYKSRKCKAAQQISELSEKLIPPGRHCKRIVFSMLRYFVIASKMASRSGQKKVSTLQCLSKVQTEMKRLAKSLSASVLGQGSPSNIL
jgi:hypothetical protein